MWISQICSEKHNREVREKPFGKPEANARALVVGFLEKGYRATTKPKPGIVDNAVCSFD